jgi:photosystem II stability/assembly factor-like uncharacterized protein
MKAYFCLKYLHFLILIISSSNLYSQSGWVQLNSGTTNTLYSVFFTDNNTGYLAGGSFSPEIGIVLKTTNGGNNWFQIFSLNPGPLRDIDFINSLTGIVIGDLGIIRKTTNGGISWFSQIAPNNPTLFSVSMLNENIGCITGAINLQGLGTILYTSDGGNNWLDRSLGGDNMYEDAYFFNANTGIVIGSFSNPYSILKTTNTGINWLGLYGIVRLFGLSAIDSNNIVCCGQGRRVLKTTNGGLNWIDINQQTGSPLYSIVYHDINNITSVGDIGIILRTTNAGINWLQQASGVTSSLNKVFFINPQTGWICGDNGVVLKTTTGGFTAIQPVSTEIPEYYLLYQNYPNPFNPNTKIKFQIQKPGFVKLSVFDLNGKELEKLVHQTISTGIYEIDFNGEQYSSGVYYYSLETEEYFKTKKLVILK